MCGIMGDCSLLGGVWLLIWAWKGARKACTFTISRWQKLSTYGVALVSNRSAQCVVWSGLFYRHGANTREGDLMANIAEMVKELQQERDRLDQAIAALAPLAGTSKASSARSGASGPRRTLSAAARRKVSLAQKARWAKLRAENSARGRPSTTNTGKRTISAAGLARIRAANKARWTKWRAAQKRAA